MSVSKSVGRRWGALAGVTLATVLVTGLAWAADPGDLDRSFGGDGLVRTGMHGSAGAHAVAIGSHHRIVAVGTSARFRHRVYRSRIALARYTPKGKLDHDFSGDGKAFASFGPLSYARGALMDGRDRTVVAGSTCDRLDNDPVGCEFVVARFLPNGKLDRSFGNGGRTTTAFPGEADARAVALTSHGRIVAAGVADGEIALARYRRDGRLDESFGDVGTVMTDIDAGDESGNSVAIAPHGRIVVASGGGALAVTEYARDGHLRQAFGVHGTAMALFGGHNAANSVTVDSRGRIVAAGFTQFEVGGGADRAAFALARFRPSGKLDHSFSHNGKVKTRFTKFVDYANAVAIDSRGRIVAAGVQSGLRDPAIARYRRDGRLDDSFSGDGRARAKLGPGAEAVAIDSRDRIVTAGDSDKEFGLARFIGYRHR